MSTSAPMRPSAASAVALTAGQLPKQAPWATLVVAVVVAAGLTTLAGGFNLAVTVILGTLLFFGAMYVMSHAVEGPRRAKDRLARPLRWVGRG